MSGNTSSNHCHLYHCLCQLCWTYLLVLNTVINVCSNISDFCIFVFCPSKDFLICFRFICYKCERALDHTKQQVIFNTLADKHLTKMQTNIWEMCRQLLFWPKLQTYTCRKKKYWTNYRQLFEDTNCRQLKNKFANKYLFRICRICNRLSYQPGG